MKLTCPSCGAVASLDAWANDARWREFVAVIVSLPAPLPPVVLQYLSLFRPARSALSPSRAHRLVVELRGLVATGCVKAKGRPDRLCPPHLWAKGMEEMITRQHSLDRPMPNHNYLRRVVWQLADQADAQVERMQTEGALRGDHQARQPSGTGQVSEVMNRYIEKYGDPDANQRAKGKNPHRQKRDRAE